MNRRPPREHTATPAELAREDELHRRAVERTRRPVARVALSRVSLTDRLAACKLVVATVHEQLADLLLALETDQRSRAKVEAGKLALSLPLASVACADLAPVVARIAN